MPGSIEVQQHMRSAAQLSSGHSTVQPRMKMKTTVAEQYVGIKVKLSTGQGSTCLTSPVG